jgi:hypothetical protein
MTLMTPTRHALRAGAAGFALAAALLPLSALAQVTPPAATESSPAKKELIAKVVRSQQNGVEGLARGIASDTTTRVLQAAEQGLTRVAPDKREAAAKTIETEVRKFHGELETLLKDRAAKIAPGVVGGTLDEKFSEEELRELVRWQESPVVKRYLQLGSEFEKSLGDKLIADTRSAVEPRLRNLEGTIRKALEQPGAAAGGASAPARAPAKAPAKVPAKP